MESRGHCFFLGGRGVIWYRGVIKGKSPDFKSSEVGISGAPRPPHGFNSYLKLWNLFSSSFNLLWSNHHWHLTSMEEFNASPFFMYLNCWSLGHVKPSQLAKLAVGWNHFQWLNQLWMQMRCIFPSWSKVILSFTPQDLLLMQTCQSLFWPQDSIFFPLWRLKNLQRLLENPLLDYGSVNG